MLLTLNFAVNAQQMTTHESVSANKTILKAHNTRSASLPKNSVYIDPQSIDVNGGLNCSVTPWVYAVQHDSGYVYGNNLVIGPPEHAQFFDKAGYWNGEIGDSMVIDTVFVAFGLKSGANTSDSVRIKLYKGNNSSGPSTVFGTSRGINITGIDTSTSTTVLNAFVFNPPVYVPKTSTSFFVSVVLPTVTGDTVSIVSTVSPCAEDTGRAWSIYFNKWYHDDAVWSNATTGASQVDLFVVIHALLSHPLSVNNNFDITTVMPATPNPAQNAITLNYMLNKSADITLNIYDMAGRLVQTNAAGNKSAGTYHDQIDLSSYSNGLYLYEISSNGGKAFGKFVVSK